MSERHRKRHDGQWKTAEELLGDLIWQGAVQVYFLKVIAEGIENMATAEQVAALNTAIDELEAATATEIGQINAKIDELIAAAGTAADPALDAAVARLQAERDRIAAIIPDAPPTP